MPNQWSKEIVVFHILERHRNGQKLNSNFVQTSCRPLYNASYKYFGSWRKSIKAAGLKYDQVRVTNFTCPVWSEEKIIKTIRCRKRLKLPLNSNYIQQKECRLYGAAIKYFGSWSQAIAAAGLDYSKLRRKKPMRSWSKALIAKEILRRFAEGLSIKGGDVTFEDRGLYHAALRHYGENGWAKARILAGFDPIDPRPWKIWNEQSVPAEIIRLHENGVDLSTISLRDNSYSYIHAAGRKVFGTWSKAIRASGLDYSKIRRSKCGWWTKARVLMCIKNLEKRGVRLSHRAIQQKHGDVLQGAIVYFGSWAEAVEAAGISYRLHCRVWSTKAWLRSLDKPKYDSVVNKKLTYNRKRRNR